MVTTSVTGIASGIASKLDTIKRAVAQNVFKVSKGFDCLSSGKYNFSSVSLNIKRNCGPKIYKTVSAKKPVIIRDEETGKMKLIYIR